jgi:uncharacterized integral membrane protein
MRVSIIIPVRRCGMQLFLFLAVVIAVAFIIVTVQNPSTVITLDFIKWTFSGPPAIMLSAPFIAGILTGIFAFIPTWWRKSAQARSSRKRVQELEAELARAKEYREVPGQPEE